MTETEIQHQKMVKAQAILLGGCEPEIINENVFKVPSTNGNWDYTVKKNMGAWTCTCPSHQKLLEAGIELANCKHIHVIKFWLEMKEGLDTEYLNKQYRKQDFHGCPKCGSYDVVKNGHRKNKSGKKSIFLCNDCKKTFSLKDEGFENMKFSPEIVSQALDLYFKGTSFRKVAHHISQAFNVKIGHVIIYNWIRRYSKIVSEYADSLNPELGDTWHADEMMVRIRDGGIRHGGGKARFVWLWNCMDADTRFLLANQVTTGRGVKEVRSLFKQAKEVSNTYPRTVITDGLGTYPKGIRKELLTRKNMVFHRANVGIANKTPNNKVERLHGSIRQREKVMRGMQRVDTSDELMDGYRVHYNFVRPHMALEGKTPAQEAKIDLELGHNKWKGLIKKAIENKTPERIEAKEKHVAKTTMDYWF